MFFPAIWIVLLVAGFAPALASTGDAQRPSSCGVLLAPPSSSLQVDSPSEVRGPRIRVAGPNDQFITGDDCCPDFSCCSKPKGSK